VLAFVAAAVAFVAFAAVSLAADAAALPAVAEHTVAAEHTVRIVAGAADAAGAVAAAGAAAAVEVRQLAAAAVAVAVAVEVRQLVVEVWPPRVAAPAVPKRLVELGKRPTAAGIALAVPDIAPCTLDTAQACTLVAVEAVAGQLVLGVVAAAEHIVERKPAAADLAAADTDTDSSRWFHCLLVVEGRCVCVWVFQEIKI